MKTSVTSACLVTLSAAAATAGGIERTPQSAALLFEPGNAVQLSYGSAAPAVDGTFPPNGASSGDMAPTYGTLTFGVKMAVTDRVDLALIYDQSVGADVDYSDADATYPLRGTKAELTGSDITALLRYRLAERVSVFGGVRLQGIEAQLSGLSLAGNAYGLDVDRNHEAGYVIGAAYEIPDIALRVALTYNSEIEHEFAATETLNGTPIGATPFTTTIPQSVNLEFQSGIAEDTLLFGSIRWQDWSEFDITPVAYEDRTGRSLINYESDYVTYSLGLGRRLNERWSGAVTLTHEPANGDIQGNLAPRDGYTAIGIGATYRIDRTEIGLGLRYVWLGDATTQVIGAEFEDNEVLGVGLRLTQRF